MMKTLMTRREFLVAGAVVPFALRALAESVVAGPRWVFLGTDAGKGIYRARWDATTGMLGKVELAVEADRPDFFAMHPKLPVLYTVNSVVDGKGGVSGYRVDAEGGGLEFLNRVSSHGDGPCAVSVGVDGRAVFVANYNGGSVAIVVVGLDGMLGRTPSAFEGSFRSPGPVIARQEKSHMHCVAVSPDGNFLLSCDLGADLISLFRIGMNGGAGDGPRLVMAGPYIHQAGNIAARAGSGPRHVAFHPNGRWVYCIHELDCTIDLYDWNAGKMTLRAGSVVSTLAKGAGLKGNTGCEVVVSDDGRYLYSCSRGVDEIAVYRIGVDGLLSEQQRLSCGGRVPRYIALDPSRKWLVSCNQGGAGSVTVFANDVKTGRLSESPKMFEADTPMFVQWV